MLHLAIFIPHKGKRVNINHIPKRTRKNKIIEIWTNQLKPIKTIN